MSARVLLVEVGRNAGINCFIGRRDASNARRGSSEASQTGFC